MKMLFAVAVEVFIENAKCRTQFSAAAAAFAFALLKCANCLNAPMNLKLQLQHLKLTQYSVNNNKSRKKGQQNYSLNIESYNLTKFLNRLWHCTITRA